MNWTRIVLDGLVMCVVFNVSTALLWTIAPTAFSQMMPKEIRKAAPKLTRRDFIILAGVLHPMQVLIIVYMALSAVNAGISGFWPLFWTAYIKIWTLLLPTRTRFVTPGADKSLMIPPLLMTAMTNRMIPKKKPGLSGCQSRTQNSGCANLKNVWRRSKTTEMRR